MDNDEITTALAPAEKPKRTKWLPKVRTTSFELEQILALSQKAGLSLSEYIRSACLQCHIISRQSVVDKSLILQLSAIGNNLNQLTRKAHIRDEIDPILSQHLTDTLDAINTLMDKIIHDS